LWRLLFSFFFPLSLLKKKEKSSKKERKQGLAGGKEGL
jgi:hypothetical protein